MCASYSVIVRPCSPRSSLYENINIGCVTRHQIYPGPFRNRRTCVTSRDPCWLRYICIYSKVGLFESARLQHLKVQSWFLYRIIEFVVYYRISLVLNIIMKAWRNIVFWKCGKKKYKRQENDWNIPVIELFDSTSRYCMKNDKVNNKMTSRNKVIRCTCYWIM